LQSLSPTNPHWPRVVGYGAFSLCMIYKEGNPSSGNFTLAGQIRNREKIRVTLKNDFILGLKLMLSLSLS
jgi:hypothetical protein